MNMIEITNKTEAGTEEKGIAKQMLSTDLTQIGANDNASKLAQHTLAYIHTDI